MVFGFYVGGASEFGKCAAKKTQRFLVKSRVGKTSIRKKKKNNALGNLTSRRNKTHLDVWILLALSLTQTHLDWCLNILSMTSLFLKYQAILRSIPPYLSLRYLHINLASNQVTILGLVAKRWNSGETLADKNSRPSGHSNLPLCSKSPHPELTSWSHRPWSSGWLFGGCDPKHWMVRVVLPRYRLHHPKMPHHFAESLSMRKWLPLKIHTKMKSNASITGQNISNPMMKTYCGLSLEGKMVKPAWNPSVNRKKQTPETCSWFLNHILIIDCTMV